MDTGQIILYVFAGLVLLLWLRRRLAAGSIPQVSRGESEQLAADGKAVLVDVRTAAERSRKSIARSVHLPMSDLTDISSKLDRYKDKQIIFYCASGSRSISAALKAKKLGFTVGNLQGGIGW